MGIPIFGKDNPYIGKEDIFQSSTNTFLCLNKKLCSNDFFHIPNGGKRDKRTAGKLKSQGVTAGVCDWFISVPNEKYNGLYIELKTAKYDKEGKVKLDYARPNQKEFIINQINKGYYACICYSLKSFELIIDKYLNNKL